MRRPRFRLRFSQLEVGTFVLTRLPAYVAIGIVAFLLISFLLLLVYLGLEFDSPVLHLLVRAGDLFY
jgi:hypothetical protein